MDKLWVLFKTNFIQSYSLNNLKLKTTKQKIKAVLTSIFIVILVLYISAVSGLYTLFGYDFLKKYNAQSLIITIFGVFALIAIFSLSIYKSKATIFNVKNNDMLFALPIPKTIILTNNLINLYTTNLFGMIVLLVPATIVYGVKEGLGIVYYLTSFLCYLFLPFIPSILASFVGYIVALLSSRARNKSLAEIVLTFMLFFGIMLFSFNIKNIAQNIVNNVDEINNLVNKFMYPITLMKEAILDKNLLSLGIFVLINVIFLIVFVFIVDINYTKLSSKLRENKTQGKFKERQYRENSIKTALLKRELANYFSTPIYILNTSFGVILLFITSIASIFYDKAEILKVLKLQVLPISTFQMVLLFVSFVISMSNITSSSISLEGNNLWIVKSIPVSSKQVLNSKLLVNLIVLLPLTIISIIILSFTLKLAFLEATVMILFSIVLSIFVAQFGLIINLKWPKLKFISPVQVVKQSLSVMVSIFAMFGILLTTVLIYGKIQDIIDFNNYFAIVFMVFAFECVIQNETLDTWGIEKFNKLN